MRYFMIFSRNTQYLITSFFCATLNSDTIRLVELFSFSIEITRSLDEGCGIFLWERDRDGKGKMLLVIMSRAKRGGKKREHMSR